MSNKIILSAREFCRVIFDVGEAQIKYYESHLSANNLENYVNIFHVL